MKSCLVWLLFLPSTPSIRSRDTPSSPTTPGSAGRTLRSPGCSFVWARNFQKGKLTARMRSLSCNGKREMLQENSCLIHSRKSGHKSEMRRVLKARWSNPRNSQRSIRSRIQFGSHPILFLRILWKTWTHRRSVVQGIRRSDTLRRSRMDASGFWKRVWSIPQLLDSTWFSRSSLSRGCTDRCILLSGF